MSLKQNKDKTAEEKKKETEWASEQLGFELEPLFEDANEDSAQRGDDVNHQD